MLTAKDISPYIDDYRKEIIKCKKCNLNPHFKLIVEAEGWGHELMFEIECSGCKTKICGVPAETINIWNKINGKEEICQNRVTNP